MELSEFPHTVQRVWTVLEEKNIPYQYIEAKSESLLKLNSRGLVPTLEYDNKPLYESTVFCEFLEDAYPDHGLKLPLAGRPLYQGQDENLDRLRWYAYDSSFSSLSAVSARTVVINH